MPTITHSQLLSKHLNCKFVLLIVGLCNKINNEKLITTVLEKRSKEKELLRNWPDCSGMKLASKQILTIPNFLPLLYLLLIIPNIIVILKEMHHQVQVINTILTFIPITSKL